MDRAKTYKALRMCSWGCLAILSLPIMSFLVRKRRIFCFNSFSVIKPEHLKQKVMVALIPFRPPLMGSSARHSTANIRQDWHACLCFACFFTNLQGETTSNSSYLLPRTKVHLLTGATCIFGGKLCVLLLLLCAQCKQQWSFWGGQLA